MKVRCWIVLIALGLATVLAVDGCGAYGYGNWYSDLNGRPYYNDPFSDCPRNWIIGPLDCRDCHYYY